MKKNDTSAVYRLIVIGGGAAGLYAGAAAGLLCPAFPKKHRGLILERKPEPGKKLMITGSGQCNITHSGSIKNFSAHYHEAGKKIRTLLYAHSNEQVVSTFASMGLRTFVREDGKIFPESLSAREVRDILRRHCEKNGFSIQTDLMCTGLIPLGSAEEKDSSSLSSRSKPAPIAVSGVAGGSGSAAAARWKVICGRREYLAENVLVAAGGASVPETGSDGSFLRVLTELNFPISPVAPALVPVFIQRYPFRELSGISFADASLSVFGRGGRKKEERRGSLLLTHDALSGPCIIDSSRQIETGDRLKINWISASSTEALLRALTETAEKSKASVSLHAARVLREAGTPLPQRFLDLQLLRCGLDPAQRAAQTGRKKWLSFLRILTEDIFSVSGKGGFASAMATRGGVCLDAVDLKTMESKQHPGLWFAGEILDVDGDTGGYNLQFAFSSAACAVKNIYSGG